MSFIFEDRNVTRHLEAGIGVSARTLSMNFSDVFEVSESGDKGNYIGTLEHLSPEPVHVTHRDYRFFDANGSQQSSTFKGEDFMSKITFEEAKEMLNDCLVKDGLTESYGYAVVEVSLEGVDPKVPYYLRLDRDYYVWSVDRTPSLISMKHLTDMDNVLSEASERNSWLNIESLKVVEISK